MSFSTLGLGPKLLQAVRETGYTTPTPIQSAAIPHILGGHDLIGIAQTGTGKTAAFALPILHRLTTATPHTASHKPQAARPIRTLVLSPTRELASQIADSFRAYGRHLKHRTAVRFLDDGSFVN